MPNWINPRGFMENLAIKRIPRAMSAAIAAAMVRAACRHQKAKINIDIEEVTKQFEPFQPQLLYTFEAFGADFVDSIALVHRFIMEWLPPNIHSA